MHLLQAIECPADASLGRGSDAQFGCAVALDPSGAAPGGYLALASKVQGPPYATNASTLLLPKAMVASAPLRHGEVTRASNPRRSKSPDETG